MNTLRFSQSVMLFLSIAATAPAAADESANSLDGSPPPPVVVPAGTRVRFHLDDTLSSAKSKTGQHFSFTLLDPIEVVSQVLAPAGAHGDGTLILAGHAGKNGHEGDLTLRLDSVRSVDGNRLAFTDQRFQINGKNRKVAAGVLGFVPYVGLGARLIRGNESQVDPERPIVTVLKKPAVTAPA
jgi:hypothetical protein